MPCFVLGHEATRTENRRVREKEHTFWSQKENNRLIVTDSRPRKAKCKARNGASEKQSYFTLYNCTPPHLQHTDTPAWGVGEKKGKMQRLVKSVFKKQLSHRYDTRSSGWLFVSPSEHLHSKCYIPTFLTLHFTEVDGQSYKSVRKQTERCWNTTNKKESSPLYETCFPPTVG